MLSPRLSALALFGLAILAAQADAQPGRPGPPVGPGRRVVTPGSAYAPMIVPFAVNPNRYIAPNTTARQIGYNIAVLGQAAAQVPPWVYGYNPYPSPIISTGPVIPGVGSPAAPINPYSLSTAPVGGGNPYDPTGSLSTSPYSLSTVPGAGGYGGGYPPYPAYYPQDPYSASVQGLASLTAATGQYYTQVQQARLLREQSRSAAMDNARKRLELEAWYESIRPTAPKLAAKERANDLEVARKYATATDVATGRALNTLLNNLPTSGLNKGDSVPLDEETLRDINVSAGSGSGNIGLLKGLTSKDADLPWPEALRDSAYDETRKRLRRDLVNAVQTLQDKHDITPERLRSIRQDYKAIADRINESADELDAGQFIAARRFLGQLKSSIDALSSPKAKNYFGTWTPKGKTVAELVANMKKEGLTFAPAAPGEEAAYNALYQALRNFEASLGTGLATDERPERRAPKSDK